MSNLNKLPQPGPGCVPPGVTDNQGIGAFALRFGTATNEAVKTGSVTHPVNTDLTNFKDGLGTYTKALKQASPAIVAPATYKAFLQACGLAPGGTIGDFSDPSILRGGTAKLNGPRGALAGQLIGKDSQGFGAPLIPPAAALDSVAYAIELIELYWASLVRDVPFAEYATDPTAQAAAAELSDLAAANPSNMPARSIRTAK